MRDASRAPAPSGAPCAIAEFAGYADGESMRAACDGISTLLLVSAREAEDRVEQHRTAIDAAAAAGVERIVYLSFIGAAPDATFTSRAITSPPKSTFARPACGSRSRDRTSTWTCCR